MNHARLITAVVVSDLFAENSYIIHLEGSRDCLVVDPGLDPNRICERIEQESLIPAAILNTHGHADHIAGNAAVKERWPDCPLVIGANEVEKLTDPVLNLSASYGLGLTSPEADVLLGEGDVYSAAGIELEVFDTPGHSAGHIIFVYKGDKPWTALVGDVIFEGSVGRTDFPDGDMEQLVASIHGKVFTLPDDTLLLPGHGGPTTVEREKKGNPFVGAPAGYRE